MIKVLSVTSECAPLVKTGGLADVAGALPLALAAHNVHMRTLLPGYPAVMKQLSKPKTVMTLTDIFGGTVRVLASTIAGLDLLVVDAPHLFKREGNIYSGYDGAEWTANPARSSALCQVTAHIARHGIDGWPPDLCHCHDCQARLITESIRRATTRP